MQHLSPRAKQMISRFTTFTLLGIIQNLAYAIANEENFQAVFPHRHATWFTNEINTLHPHQKLELIKEITTQINL